MACLQIALNSQTVGDRQGVGGGRIGHRLTAPQRRCAELFKSPTVESHEIYRLCRRIVGHLVFNMRNRAPQMTGGLGNVSARGVLAFSATPKGVSQQRWSDGPSRQSCSSSFSIFDRRRSKRSLGFTSYGRMTRKALVRTEPHPTSAGPRAGSIVTLPLADTPTRFPPIGASGA